LCVPESLTLATPPVAVNGVAKAIGAKDIASILTKSSLQFGAAKIAQFISDLGAINTTKFLGEGSAANLVSAIEVGGVQGVNRIVLAEGAVTFGRQLIAEMTPTQLGKFITDNLAEYKLLEELATRLTPDSRGRSASTPKGRSAIRAVV
jgi:hypothetical protein